MNVVGVAVLDTVSFGAWDELKKDPFDVKKANLATRRVSKLLPQTMLRQPSSSPHA